MDEKSTIEVVGRRTVPLPNAKDERLYIVTHNELSAACQTVQVAHATAAFVLNYPIAAARWSCTSNALVVLEVENAEKLLLMHQEAKKREIEVSAFREIDLCEEITAIAFTPSRKARNMLTDLPLAGRNPKPQQMLIERETKQFILSQKMIGCEHTKDMNILQYGSFVRNHYFLLLEHLYGTVTLRNTLKWKLPSWLEENRSAVLAALPSAFVMDRYLTFNFQQQQDEIALCPKVQYLIAHNDNLFTINVKPDSDFFATGFAMAQILAGLAKITAIAALEGGLGTQNVKTNLKRIERRGKMYFDYWKAQES